MRKKNAASEWYYAFPECSCTETSPREGESVERMCSRPLQVLMLSLAKKHNTESIELLAERRAQSVHRSSLTADLAKRVANAQNVLSQECYQKNAADLGNGQTEYVSRSQQLDEDGFNRLRTNDARISTNEVYRFQSVVRLEGLRCSSINKNLERDSGSETTAKTHFNDLHISIPRCKVKRRQSGCVGGVDICPFFHECLKT